MARKKLTRRQLKEIKEISKKIEEWRAKQDFDKEINEIYEGLI